MFINVCSKKFVSFRNQSIDLYCKSVDLFLYDTNSYWKVFERYFWTDGSILMHVRCSEITAFLLKLNKFIYMCLSHFLYFLNKRTNSGNTRKWVEKPLNFFFFSCWNFIDIIKFNRLPCNILLIKKRWNRDVPRTLAFLFSPDPYHLVCHF